MDRFLIYTALFFGVALHAQDDFETLGVLPQAVLETSGLLFLDGKLITHNDSGNEAVLYELDTTSLEVTRTVTIENTVNTDWEDLAQDSLYIYIGDIGNNVGNREDLAVYRIEKAVYRAQNSVPAERISFAYGDQTDFSGNQNSDFDAEALVVFGEQLLIFTKQWQSNGTVVYGLPKVPGNHVAQPVTSYQSNGLITGASYDAGTETLMLCGYSQQLRPFVISTTGISGQLAFNATTTRFNLPLSFAQIEGIAMAGNKRYFLSSEEFTNANPPITLDASLFAFTFTSEPPPDPDPDPDPSPDPDPGPDPDEVPYTEGVVVFRAPNTTSVSYDLFGDRQLFARAIFDTSGRLIRYTRIQDIESDSVDVLGIGSGVYYLTFYLRGLTISEPFVID